MANLFEISPYNLYRLQSLDPILDDNYQDILGVVFPILDTDSQNILLTNSLNPRGIFYDETAKDFYHEAPKSIDDVLHSREIFNSKLVKLAKDMQAFLDNPYQAKDKFGAQNVLERLQADQNDNQTATNKISAIDFAENLESLLYVLEQCKDTVGMDDYFVLRQIHQAFVYELAQKIDEINLTMPENRRGINGVIVKSFIKEVFLKHSLQGINFRAWDSDDLQGLNIMHFPEALKQEVQDRRLTIVETKRYWFLISPSRNMRANRYSVCRFLAEDTEFGLYLTYGCFMPRHHAGNEKLIQTILQLLGTIYTLETSASPSLMTFIEKSKQNHYRHLSPLLRAKINFNNDMESAVADRLGEYEKKLTSLILYRVPELMQGIMENNDDRLIFVHHMGQLLGDLWRDVQAFSLLPIVAFTESAQVMAVRLMCYRLILEKNQDIFWDISKDWSDKLSEILEPAPLVQEMFMDAESETEQIDRLLEHALLYEKKKDKGGFLAKLGFGRPKYSSEELYEFRGETASELFLGIIRLAKTKRNTVINYEFDSPSAIFNDENATHRHYAVAHGKHAVDRLPLVLRLPEQRMDFEVDSLKITLRDLVL